MEIVDAEETLRETIENFVTDKNEEQKIVNTNDSQENKIPTKTILTEIKEEESFSDDSQYSVEEIVNKRVFKGRVKYLVKWRGYEEPTWEKEENMNCEQLIKEFEDRKRLQKIKRKVKKGKPRDCHSKKINKLKVDLSKRGSIKNINRRGSLALGNSKQTPRRIKAFLSTPIAAGPGKNVVAKKHNEKSLKFNILLGTNCINSKSRVPNHSNSNYRRSLTNKINSWVKKKGLQRANTSVGAIEANYSVFCDNCSSPLALEPLSVENKRKRSTPLSGCSKTKRESDVRNSKGPKRLSASTSPMFVGSPLGPARTSRKPKIAERIVGARLIGQEIMFLVKWEGSDLPDWIPSRIGSLQFPQLVIKYYEDRLMWNASSAESTPR